MRNNKKLAVFDIDGTIFRKNLHFELIDELSWTKVFPREVRHRLTRLYTNWIEHRGTYEAYRLALVGLYAEHIEGCHPKDVIEASRIVAPFHRNRTYVYTDGLIHKLRKAGYFLVAISGSPIEIVREFDKEHLHFDEVYGTVYELDERGCYTGKEEFCPVKDKGRVVRQCAFDHQLSFDDSFGVGDTESDASFLELVTNPIAFNPNQNLKEIAEQKKWKVVVEKKDVVYEFNDHCLV